MTDFTQISEISQDKTRVILFGLNPKITQIIRYILDYQEKEYDFINDNEEIMGDNDFLIINTNDEKVAEILPPTILFLGSDFQIIDYENIINTITGGGILVFPEFIPNLGMKVLQTSNFFKKYEYKKPTLEASGEGFLLNTDFGKLSISIENQETLNDIDGARQFCQQLGVMEDEFYDALSTFS